MFENLHIHERLLKALKETPFQAATEVQKQVIPTLLKGDDCFVTAPTGTGKTLAFLLPLLQHLLEHHQPGSGLSALIITPTRELAIQIHKELILLSQYTFFKSQLVVSDEGLKEQAAKLRKNPDIVIGTPRRLSEQWKNKQLILQDLSFLVLDEADRTLDIGLSEEVTTLLNHCPLQKQTVFVSATRGDKTLEALANSILKSPKKLHLNENVSVNTIQQQIIFADHLAHKLQILQWLIANQHFQQVLIFTNTKNQANEISQQLAAVKIDHLVLHSDKSPQERKFIMQRFYQSHMRIMVATDIAARGLDIKCLDLIINFDLPNTTDEYIHRIGRTGRLGKAGTAISMITPKDRKKLAQLEQALNNPFERFSIPALPCKLQNTLPTSKSEKNKHINTLKKTPKPKKSHKQPLSKASSIVSADGNAPLKHKTKLNKP